MTRSTRLLAVMLCSIAGVPARNCKSRAMRRPTTELSAPLSTRKR